MSDATKKVPSQAEIEFLAYQIFLERGGEPGHDLSDWLEAEEQLKTRSEAEAPSTQRTETAPSPIRKSAAGA
ncbi:MAG TPA: DUF2934 domain-containing protein [Candidatus Acidoferrales bacterium]|jgi:hypothetical protein|nr:DUF2934 domain-containing protein [Candidatus Acidoferrales bacterium]